MFDGRRQPVEIAPQVAQALANGAPVVALESALVTHGLPRPANLRVARRLESAVQEEGGVPATIALLEGIAHVGLSPAQLERLAGESAPAKVSLRDLPAV
ncbi:MAG TPA: pseudouridine-5-phosphate glycosidase, partial [Anaerolineae bacterium]|nr:pseudouridine-5-phosphate glycosidase [Anaerolineae bacterium]